MYTLSGFHIYPFLHIIPLITYKFIDLHFSFPYILTALVEIFLRISQKLSSIFLFFNFLRNFSDPFRKFSIVCEDYRIRNLIFKEKRRQFRLLKNCLPFSPDISYFLWTRWDWETKNSKKIAETLNLKNSVKNLIFSVKNFYFIRIQQNWEHDNFEKI